MTDSLEHLRQRITDLTDPDGDFAVVCPLSGKCPVPVRGESFPSADAAEEAVDLVVEYRKLLREVDPHLENVPIVATERGDDPLAFDAREQSERAGEASGRRRRLCRSVSLSGEGDDEWLRMENAPVVHVRRDGELLDDETVSRQLRAALR
ncbi:hypothetical protein M0R88_14615 [Halorussus gelatinilyticus]|uniref:DUF7552 domain-containing protein n=1 Tax=Halorussus gelatinilyticus TaxID=2937524 RepID=A0A8U0IF88_9EURY|nr:hypothetical protein [Halorussus gelatinilyticus]UPV99739.1 hypothetical protein M0R88_14615 [Halorussus gelatinilyticus]